MKKSWFVFLVLCLLAGSGWSVSVTVNKAGSGGAFTTIQAAINSGANHITITDSSVYNENVTIGDNNTTAGGPAVTLTSNKTGDQRPTITSNDAHTYDDAQRSDRAAVIHVFAPNSQISNLIIEANPEVPNGAMVIIASGVTVENCLFRPGAGLAGSLPFQDPLIFFGSQGSGGGSADEGGRQCDNVIIKDSELNGVAPDKDPEPTAESKGYLDSAISQANQLVRTDIYSHESGGSSRIIDITFENCYIHHSSDLHLFPSNRGDAGGNLIIYLMNCRLDAAAKFSIRGRGACVVADHSIFTRTNQGPHGDGENSAIAINRQDGHADNFARATDCIFVNCGSAQGKKGYYGGVNNHNSDGTVEVNHCTFYNCLSGASVGTGGNDTTEDTKTRVTESIFHNIGYNAPPAVDVDGLPLGPETPLDPPGLYKAWSFGLAVFQPPALWTAAFNNFSSPNAIIEVQDCLVGTVADEDSRLWADVVAIGLSDAGNVLGSRLSCGDVGADQRVRFLNPIVRGTPIFLNTDPDEPVCPFELAPNSPGQGWGARFGSCGSAVSDWAIYH